MIIKPHFPGIYGLLDSLRQKWGTFRSPPTPGLHSTAGCGNTHSGFLDSPEIHHLHVQSSPGWRATMFSCPPSPPSLDKGSHLLFPCPHPFPAPSSTDDLHLLLNEKASNRQTSTSLRFYPSSFPCTRASTLASLLCPWQGPLSSCRAAQPRSFLQKSPSPLSRIINFPLYWIFPISIQMSYYFSYKNKNSNQNSFWPHFPSSYLSISCLSNSSKADAAEQPLVLHSLNLPSHHATPIPLSRSPMTSTLLNPMTHFLTWSNQQVFNIHRIL